MIVVDSSVFVKLLVAEDDSAVARAFMIACHKHRMDFGAPDLFRFEVLGFALHHGLPFLHVRELIEIQEAAGFRIYPLTSDVIDRAETIAKHGNKKSGYPSLQDSLYHALAIETGGTFITADRKHLEKTMKFGHATLLQEWEVLPVFKRTQ